MHCHVERAIRIGGFSGYLGDRFTGVAEVLAGDPVDVLIGDYLAEITLARCRCATGATRRTGTWSTSSTSCAPHLGVLAERGAKVRHQRGRLPPRAWPRRRCAS
ncbi:hypothetical protein GCM10020366_72140 [Saccharopolyspora gregorii]|uniref:Acyclic terpene utilisation N-terminal domain-containing protein n=1 Tax=Saccharopolyspora gregorii TaxID=33914 RepID=A0ABP6S381_9PSEU